MEGGSLAPRWARVREEGGLPWVENKLLKFASGLRVLAWLNGGCAKQPNCAFAHPEHLKGAGSYVASPSKGGGGKKPAAGGAAEDG